MTNDEKRTLKVFLCHASGDKPQVRNLYKRLSTEGVDAWLDQEKLLPGQDWRVEIPRAVQEADVVVVCLSNKSITKEGYIQKEIKFALDSADEKPDGTIFLIPARLEDCPVPEKLSRWQWVDLFEDNGYLKLLSSLKLRADKVGAVISPASYQEGDAETERRLDQYYTEGLAAFYTEDWDKACQRFQLILREKPNHKIAIEKLEEAERQRDLAKLYAQTTNAIQAQDWQAAIRSLEDLLKRTPDYKDSALLYKNAKKQKQLKELYAEAKKLHAAEKWQAVVKVFDQILSIEPNHPDSDGLLPSAQKEVAELKRLSDLNELYAQAVREMDMGKWYEARALLEQVHKAQTGFLETERLLRKTEDEILKIEESNARVNQVNTLYEQAHGLLRAKNWRQALDKMNEIQKLDSQFEDKDGIVEKVKAELEREEQEAQKQNQLAAMYADAVRLLKEGKYQESLEKWDEVKAIDPKYPDRQQVQKTLQRKLAETGKEKKLFLNRLFVAFFITTISLLFIIVISLLISFGRGILGSPTADAPTISATTVINTPTLSLTQAPLSPIVIATSIAKSTESNVLHNDFEQPGLDFISGSDGNWLRKEVNGNGLLEIYSPSRSGLGNLPFIDFGSEVWANYLFGFRFKVNECIPKDSENFSCIIIIKFRCENDQCYVLLINTNDNTVDLKFGKLDDLKEFNYGTTHKILSLPLENSWHNVLLTADREGISAAVDGTWTSAVSDDRFYSGGISIELGERTTAQFDDFDVWVIP